MAVPHPILPSLVLVLSAPWSSASTAAGDWHQAEAKWIEEAGSALEQGIDGGVILKPRPLGHLDTLAIDVNHTAQGPCGLRPLERATHRDPETRWPPIGLSPRGGVVVPRPPPTSFGQDRDSANNNDGPV